MGFGQPGFPLVQASVRQLAPGLFDFILCSRGWSIAFGPCWQSSGSEFGFLAAGLAGSNSQHLVRCRSILSTQLIGLCGLCSPGDLVAPRLYGSAQVPAAAGSSYQAAASRVLPTAIVRLVTGNSIATDLGYLRFQPPWKVGSLSSFSNGNSSCCFDSAWTSSSGWTDAVLTGS